MRLMPAQDRQRVIIGIRVKLSAENSGARCTATRDTLNYIILQDYIRGMVHAYMCTCVRVYTYIYVHARTEV